MGSVFIVKLCVTVNTTTRPGDTVYPTTTTGEGTPPLPETPSTPLQGKLCGTLVPPDVGAVDE